MVASYKVTCIRRGPLGAGPDGAILAIGGPEAPGLPQDHRRAAMDPAAAKPLPWSKPTADVIADLRSGASAYYVSLGLRTAGLVIVENGGRPYLKTAFDPGTPDLLLGLPDCP